MEYDATAPEAVNNFSGKGFSFFSWAEFSGEKNDFYVTMFIYSGSRCQMSDTYYHMKAFVMEILMFGAPGLKRIKHCSELIHYLCTPQMQVRWDVSQSSSERVFQLL